MLLSWNSAPPLPPPPQVWIRRELICRIMTTVGALKPESGGILIGPVGTERITDFYFDTTARCTGGTYTPDVVTLKKKMRDEWLPAGLDLKGFCHSHPHGVDRLSGGDLEYIRRLLSRNPDMRFFAAPIVLPEEFSYRVFIVMADAPHVPRATTFRLF